MAAGLKIDLENTGREAIIVDQERCYEPNGFCTYSCPYQSVIGAAIYISYYFFISHICYKYMLKITGEETSIDTEHGNKRKEL